MVPRGDFEREEMSIWDESQSKGEENADEGEVGEGDAYVLNQEMIVGNAMGGFGSQTAVDDECEELGIPTGDNSAGQDGGELDSHILEQSNEDKSNEAELVIQDRSYHNGIDAAVMSKHQQPRHVVD